MPIFIDKNNINLLQNNTNQSLYCKYVYVQAISSKLILNKRLLVFKTQGLYCHELIFCKWVNLENSSH